MRFVAIIAVAVLALVFGAVNGALMFASPRYHAAFWRWYTRSGRHGVEIEPGVQIQLRAAGLIIFALSIFFGWMLTENIASRCVSFDARKGIMFGITRGGNWFGMLAGGLAITAGVCAFLRTSSLASWLRGHGVQHSLPTAVFLRRIRTLGVLFILVGGFFVFVATRGR